MNQPTLTVLNVLRTDAGHQPLPVAGGRPVHWHDYHATVLHLLGINHKRLTYYHNRIQRRLTNVHGEVIREILS